MRKRSTWDDYDKRFPLVNFVLPFGAQTRVYFGWVVYWPGDLDSSGVTW
jgi:hypothetical protein